tara:strand:- start:545 stop:2065 length:1521 start_codon:yes stop_codon:yes gene_type:complete
MKSKLIILTLLASFLFNGCDDEFLEEDIYSQITPELLFTSASNAQLSVNAIYARYFDEWGTYRALAFALGMQVNQEITFQRANGNSDLKFNGNNGQLSSVWKGLYRAINGANVTIDGVGAMEAALISDESKNKLIAEARFLRAHGYYHLLRYWGGVPLHTEPTQNPEEAVLPKDTHQAVFEFIVEDLKFAQQYLPLSYTGSFPDSGKATKGSATATLAMVYAQVSGVQFEGFIDKDYWNEARTELVKLVDVGNPRNAASPYTYSLEPDFKDLFWGGQNPGGVWQPTRTANDLGREIIWCANYDPGAFANKGTWYFNHWSRGISEYVVNKFEAGDYRDEISLDHVSFAAQEKSVSAKIKRNLAGNNNENNVYFARYAGMILLLAEVENEINSGPTPLALSCINAVRERARGGLDGAETRAVPADILTGLSYDLFKDAVFDERAVELMLEYQFWPDILRSGRLERDYADLGSGADGDRTGFEARWNFWPIPESEILAAGGIILQNPGH